MGLLDEGGWMSCFGFVGGLEGVQAWMKLFDTCVLIDDLRRDSNDAGAVFVIYLVGNSDRG